MPAQEVADSTDWLSTPLSGLAAVEAALRCQVCKDFYRTPMITTCSHTFCSICIRRALSSDGKCPLCRAAEQELKLRSNWSMEETVEAFSKARDAVLEVARGALKRESTPKRKSDEGETSSQPESKRVRTSARLSSRAEQQPPAPAPPPPVDVVEDSEDDEYVPDDPDGLVPCPSCQKKMKAWQVFQHLESCPGPVEEPQPEDTSTFGQQQRKQQRTYDRLPALNYSMFKEQALRKKLAEMGISNQGPRHLLERRHKEWLTIWNANCDAATPKRRNELLQDLDVWERTQGGKAPTMGKAVQNAAIIKDKEFDGAAWATKHDSSFKDLIANARKSRLEAKKRAEENKEEPAPTENGQNQQDTEMINAVGQQNEVPTSGDVIIPHSPPQIPSIPTQAEQPGTGQ